MGLLAWIDPHEHSSRVETFSFEPLFEIVTATKTRLRDVHPCEQSLRKSDGIEWPHKGCLGVLIPGNDHMRLDVGGATNIFHFVSDFRKSKPSLRFQPWLRVRQLDHDLAVGSDEAREGRCLGIAVPELGQDRQVPSELRILDRAVRFDARGEELLHGRPILASLEDVGTLEPLLIGRAPAVDQFLVGVHAVMALMKRLRVMDSGLPPGYLGASATEQMTRLVRARVIAT